MPGDKHPDDRWYAWISEQWIAIPPEKIVPDYAPDGQPYLFMAPGSAVLRKTEGRHMRFVVSFTTRPQAEIAQERPYGFHTCAA